MISSKASLVLLAALSIASAHTQAADEDEVYPAALARTFLEGSIPLDQALRTTEREGLPISGKYEAENGALQLSVYIAKQNGFSEVIIDYRTGTIKTTEPITDSNDLAEAEAES